MGARKKDIACLHIFPLCMHLPVWVFVYVYSHTVCESVVAQ